MPAFSEFIELKHLPGHAGVRLSFATELAKFESTVFYAQILDLNHSELV